MYADMNEKPGLGLALRNEVVLRDFLGNNNKLKEYCKNDSERKFLIEKILESDPKLTYMNDKKGNYVLAGPRGGVKFIFKKDDVIINSRSKTASSVASLFGIKGFKNAYDAEVKSKATAKIAERVLEEQRISLNEINSVIEEIEDEPDDPVLSEEPEEPSLTPKFKDKLKEYVKIRESPEYKEFEETSFIEQVEDEGAREELIKKESHYLKR